MAWRILVQLKLFSCKSREDPVYEIKQLTVAIRHLQMTINIENLEFINE